MTLAATRTPDPHSASAPLKPASNDYAVVSTPVHKVFFGNDKLGNPDKMLEVAGIVHNIIVRTPVGIQVVQVFQPVYTVLTTAHDTAAGRVFQQVFRAYDAQGQVAQIHTRIAFVANKTFAEAKQPETTHQFTASTSTPAPKEKEKTESAYQSANTSTPPKPKTTTSSNPAPTAERGRSRTRTERPSHSHSYTRSNPSPQPTNSSYSSSRQEGSSRSHAHTESRSSSTPPPKREKAPEPERRSSSVPPQGHDEAGPAVGVHTPLRDPAAQKFLGEKVGKPITENSSDYEVLGLDKNASKDDVRKAFKKTSLAVHPDKVPEADRAAAKEAQQRVNAAYDNLKNK